MQYVMYVFRTGHCRLEQVTARRPAHVIEAELRAMWGSMGTVQTVTDMTDRVETALTWSSERLSATDPRRD